MLVMQRNSDVLYQEKRIRASVQTLKFSLKCMLVFFFKPSPKPTEKVRYFKQYFKTF